MDFSNAFFFFLIIVPSAIIHEYAHAFVADVLGDPTARNAGRLTLNPVVHIDPFGTLLLPLLFLLSGGGVLFAYAKPVPYKPQNLRNQRFGPAMVGLAGPAANILVALVMGLLIRVPAFASISEFLVLVLMANVGLAVFNMIPIPPLDGSKLLYSFFPQNYRLQYYLEKNGFFILIIAIIFFGRFLSFIIVKIVSLIV